MKVLLVEDEQRIAAAIKEGLMQDGYAVDVCHDGNDGLQSALNDNYDVIVLDVMLPGLNGYAICREIRAHKLTTPILMLTAKDQPEDIVVGLDGGADDYLAKPFSFDVLLARLRALLRRPGESLPEILQAGDLSMNLNTHEVYRGETEIKLSGKEYAILEYLLRNQGRVLSKQNIMSHVWDFDADILPNNIEVFITYLRQKIDKPFKGEPLLKTVRGFGYKIEATAL